MQLGTLWKCLFPPSGGFEKPKLLARSPQLMVIDNPDRTKHPQIPFNVFVSFMGAGFKESQVCACEMIK